MKADRICSLTAQNADGNVHKRANSKRHITLARRKRTPTRISWSLIGTAKRWSICLRLDRAKCMIRNWLMTARLSIPDLPCWARIPAFRAMHPLRCCPTSQKKPRGRDLTEAELRCNRLLSSVRISVEHALAGVKRSRIVKDVLRNSKVGFSDRIMEIACALHNWRTASRHPVPTLNLLDLAALSYSQ